MYAPEHFRERDPGRMLDLMTRNSFAVLTSFFDDRLHVTHVPLLLSAARDADGLPHQLVGHLAAGNAHGAAASEGAPTVAVFSGASAYITPRWYREEPDVPTWNYEAVHVAGTFHLIHGWGEVRALLERTVDHYEGGAEKPWHLGDIDPAIADGFQKGVTAFRIAVTEISATSKYSQDKQPRDRASTIQGLRDRGSAEDSAVAQAMQRCPDRWSG